MSLPKTNQGFPRLARKTYSPSRASPFNTGAPAAPQKSEGEFSLNDAHLEYLKRLSAGLSQASAIDAAAPAASFFSSDKADFSGGVLGHLAAMAGVDPLDLNRFGPSPIGGNPAPRLVRVDGNNAPAAISPRPPVVPLAFPGSLDSSRGPADWMTALTGVDPKYPARSALDEILLGLISGGKRMS
jgi:hypothetical protein